MQVRKSKQKQKQKEKELEIETLNKKIQKVKEESENEEMDEEEQPLTKKKVKKMNQGKNKDETKDKNQDISKEKKKEKDKDKDQHKNKKKDKKKDKKGKSQIPQLVINSADSEHFEQEENQDEEFQEKAFENQDQEEGDVDEQLNLEIYTKGIEAQRIEQTYQMGFHYCSFVKQSEDNIEQILNSVQLSHNEIVGINKIKSKLKANQDIQQDDNKDLSKQAILEDLQQYDEMGKPIKKQNKGLIRLTHSFRIR